MSHLFLLLLYLIIPFCIFFYSERVIANELESTSLVITLPAAVNVLSPIDTGAINIVLEPTKELLPIFVLNFEYPS